MSDEEHLETCSRCGLTDECVIVRGCTVCDDCGAQMLHDAYKKERDEALARADALEAKLRLLEADRARLDWLLQQDWSSCAFDTREVIDHFMKSECLEQVKEEV